MEERQRGIGAVRNCDCGMEERGIKGKDFGMKGRDTDSWWGGVKSIDRGHPQ